jgi:hypothetical protein
MQDADPQPINADLQPINADLQHCLVPVKLQKIFFRLGLIVKLKQLVTDVFFKSLCCL